MSCKISVITVNFNNKIGLEKTVKSVLGQSYDDFEFIIIDGGSTDGSVDIIQEFKDRVTHWVSEPDKGVYNAMNKGIRVANGEFVIFMNSGDTFVDKNVLYDCAVNITNDFDIYYGDNYKVKENGSKRLKTYPSALQFSFFYTSSINHQSTFIRKSLFDDHFYYNENYKIVADWEFFIYAICYKNVPYKYLAKTIANYDFTGVSSLERNKHLAAKEKAEVLKKYFPSFANDYISISELNSKRIKQVLHIKQYTIAYSVLKFFINIILIFIPKNNK